MFPWSYTFRVTPFRLCAELAGLRRGFAAMARLQSGHRRLVKRSFGRESHGARVSFSYFCHEHLRCRSSDEESVVDRDRIKGTGDKAKGARKDTASKMTRNKKLQTEGKADKVNGAAHTVAGDVKVLSHSDPEHWRKRAEDARVLTRLMSDPVSKEAMIEIANNYDRLAARAVERLDQSTQGRTKSAA
jgi:uncharacterized protein YjbJ (UPF0337 family)